MNLFQVLGVTLIGILVALSVISVLRRRACWRSGSLWILIWLATGYVLVRPGITVVAARAIGIGRGADLVVYSAILMTMVGFFLTYLRARQQDRIITRLVRHIALTDAASWNADPGAPRENVNVPEGDHVNRSIESRRP